MLYEFYMNIFVIIATHTRNIRNGESIEQKKAMGYGQMFMTPLIKTVTPSLHISYVYTSDYPVIVNVERVSHFIST